VDKAEIARLANAIQSILPENVALAVDSVVNGLEEEVFKEEAAQMVRAVPKRRLEFFAGRAAAHRAMVALGISPVPVLMGKDRAPVWPVGLIGSISHCSEICVALVATTENYQSLAVDIEPDTDLPMEVTDLILSPTEESRLARLPKKDRGWLARLIFSAKETVFKLQYPITKKMLEFNDVEIVFDVGARFFEARFAQLEGFSFSNQALVGRFGHIEGRVFCIMFLR